MDKEQTQIIHTNINRVCAVYFSATGTTKKIVRIIGDKLISELYAKTGNNPSLFVYDFTLPQFRNNYPSFNAGDIVILGVPVYAGRVPNLLLPFLENIKANGALAVPVVLFGNRNFDDALIELRDILEYNGFHTIAAAAFVGQHSFSPIIAAGRPDNNDVNLATQFSIQIIDKISKILSCSKSELLPIPVPGASIEERVYYQPKGSNGNKIDIRKVKPLTAVNCNKCAICASICPMGAIDIEFPNNVIGICIKCGACVRFCPLKAKYFNDQGYLYHVKELEEKLLCRVEAKTFI